MQVGYPPLGLLHDLGGHPAGRAHKGIACQLLVAPGAAALHCGCHPKICQQHLPDVVDQDVASLHMMPLQLADVVADKVTGWLEGLLAQQIQVWQGCCSLLQQLFGSWVPDLHISVDGALPMHVLQSF